MCQESERCVLPISISQTEGSKITGSKQVSVMGRPKNKSASLRRYPDRIWRSDLVENLSGDSYFAHCE